MMLIGLILGVILLSVVIYNSGVSITKILDLSSLIYITASLLIFQVSTKEIKNIRQLFDVLKHKQKQKDNVEVLLKQNGYLIVVTAFASITLYLLRISSMYSHLSDPSSIGPGQIASIAPIVYGLLITMLILLPIRYLLSSYNSNNK